MNAYPGHVARRRVGSGVVVAFGLGAFALTLLIVVQLVGWNATWRALGVTPLQPPFFDMHVINDYAGCAAKGADPYVPRSCNAANFNIPRTWLLVASLGIEGKDSVWLSLVVIATAAIIVTLLFRGRTWLHGV